MKTQEIKDKYVARAKMHQDADDFIKGVYWENDKGCCVGCLAHVNYDAHRFLANDTDAPEWVYYLADALFEGLEIKKAKKFPLKFVSAMPVGLSSQEWDEKVKAPFLIYVLEQSLETFDHDKSPDAKNAINQCIELWKRDDINSDDFVWAAEAAEVAARASRAYRAALATAFASRIARATALAAAEAAKAAEWAADGAAARAAYWAADGDASRAADGDASRAAYKNQADKLLEIMEEVRRDERSN